MKKCIGQTKFGRMLNAMSNPTCESCGADMGPTALNTTDAATNEPVTEWRQLLSPGWWWGRFCKSRLWTNHQRQTSDPLNAPSNGSPAAEGIPADVSMLMVRESGLCSVCTQELKTAYEEAARIGIPCPMCSVVSRTFEDLSEPPLPSARAASNTAAPPTVTLCRHRRAEVRNAVCGLSNRIV